MRELNVSNDILFDRAKLAEVWDRDGYWFFRDVLNKDKIAKFRKEGFRILADMGQVRSGDADAKWTGSDPSKIPPRVDMRDEGPWNEFTSDPSIKGFFRHLLQDEPFWVPIMGFVATPPSQDPASRLTFVHQDGFYNKGIPFRTCWLPLVDIPEELGGLAVAEGQHRRGYLNDMSKPPMFLVPPGAVPSDAWRRANYHPGDVVIFDLSTPHSGMTNLSDRFRLSLDIRVMPASGPVPAIGTISESDARAVTVRNKEGGTVRFVVDENTYCRDVMANQVSLGELLASLRPDDEVIVATSGDGRASVIRPRRG